MDAYATTLSDVALVTVVVVVTLVGLFTGTLVVVQRRYFRRLSEHYRREVQSAEDRMSIACDLHDELGPTLGAATMQLAHLKEDEPVLERRVGDIEKNLDVVAEGIRRISRNLVPATLMKHGLEKEISDYVQQLEITYGVRFEVTIPRLRAVSFDVAVLLSPIIREVLYNSVRHSGCDTVTLEIVEQRRKLSVICRDNGKGFDWETAERGLGLRSIEGRLHLAGGTMRQFSSVEKGTSYLFEIPIKKRKWKRLR